MLFVWMGQVLWERNRSGGLPKGRNGKPNPPVALNLVKPLNKAGILTYQNSHAIAGGRDDSEDELPARHEYSENPRSRHLITFSAPPRLAKPKYPLPLTGISRRFLGSTDQEAGLIRGVEITRPRSRRS